MSQLKKYKGRTKNVLKVLNKAYKQGRLKFTRHISGKYAEPCFYTATLNDGVKVATVVHTFRKGKHVWHVTSNHSGATERWLIKRITELYYE